jgi:hypothetical protein
MKLVNFLKSIFFNPALRPEDLIKTEDEKRPPMTMDEIFEDLPPVIGMSGQDQSLEVKEHCMRAYPPTPSHPNQRHNRRQLYMSIRSLRQPGSRRPWNGDGNVEKLATPRVV